MTERLVNQSNLTRRLRQFLVLFTLLLMPLGTWAEDYDLWIGNVQVTDANKDDLAAANSNIKVGNATFDPTNNILYLNGIQTKDCIKSELASLRISLQGANRIGYVANADDHPAIYSEVTHGTLGFMKPQNYASLYMESMQVKSVIYGFSSFNYSDDFKVSPIENVSYNEELGLNDGEDGVLEATFYTGSLYPIWVGETQVTSANLSDIKDDNISSGTVSYNPTANVLTLKNVNINMASDDPYVVESSIENLKVRLVGENEVTLDAEMYGTTGPNPIAFANFTGTAGETSPTLTFRSEWDKNNSSFGSLTVKGAGTETIIAQGYTVSNTWVTNDNVTTGWKKTINSDNVKVWYRGDTYDLTINGVTVTTDNAENVLEGFGSGVLSFNANTNTLTFNDLMDYPENKEPYITNGLESLTINLLGYSRILGSNTYFLAKSGDGEGNNTVTFTTDSQNPGSLEFYGSNYSPFYTSHTVNWSNGLGWKLGGDSDYGSCVEITADNSLSVGGVILCDNEGYYFDDGLLGESVSFDEDTHTLTLNNATINGNIVVKNNVLSTLNIKVKGENVINAGNQSAIKVNIHPEHQTENVTLSFIKDGEGDCSLQLNSDNVTAISGGFDEGRLTYTDLVLVVEDKNLNPSYYSNVGLCHYPDFTPITSATITSSYGLTIGGTKVTALNCNNVFKDDETNDGKVSFKASTHTLTLDGANLADMSISYSETENLTIALKGNSKVFQISYMNGDATEIPQLLFTKDTGVTDCSLEINSNGDGSVISGFSNVSFGDFNTLSLGPVKYGKMDPDESYMCLLDASDEPVSKVTVTTAVTYPLWVAGVQVTETNASHILGENNQKVTFTPAVSSPASPATLTLNGAQFSGTINWTDPSDLKVEILGSNIVDVDYSSFFRGNKNANLILATNASNPGQLKLTTCLHGSEVSGWKNDDLIYNTERTDTIAADFDWWADFSVSDQSLLMYNKKYDLWVDNVRLCSAQSEIVYGQTNVSNVISFDGNHTLTFNNVTANSSNNPFIKNGLSSLEINLVGGSSVICGALFLDKKTGDDDHNVTFKTNSNVAGTLVVTTTGDEDDPWYEGHDTPTVKDLIFTDEIKNSVRTLTFSAPTPYDLSVAGVRVTNANASNITGTGFSGNISYDADSNTLTLDGAYLAGDKGDIIYSGNANLTIAIKNSNSVGRILREGQVETLPKLTFKSVNGSTLSSLRIASDFASYFSEVEYKDWLGMKTDILNQTTYYDIISKVPSIYGEWNGDTQKWYVALQQEFDGTAKYSVTYADENLAANNVTNQNYSEAFELLGPATITSTLTIDEDVSPAVTAYYFGVLPNPLKFEYDGKTAPSFAATLYPSVDGVTFTPSSSPGSFASVSEGVLTINGLGRGLAYAGLTLPENREFTVITDSIAFMMEVVPSAPTISLASGTYSSTHDPITITGTGLDNTTIKYKWSGMAQNYTKAIDILDGTLTAWEEYTPAEGGDVLASDEATATYTLEYALDVAFVGTNRWATYCGAENYLTVPEGLTAYAVSGVNETSGVVTVESIGYIPAEEAILLNRAENAAASGYIATAYDGEMNEIDNYLCGSYEDINVTGTEATVYVLYNDAFVKTTSGTIPAYRGFLVFGDPEMSQLPQAPVLTIDLGGNTTGVNGVITKKAEVAGDIYDLQGRKVQKLSKKGLYISNGRKVVVNK